MHKNTKKLNGEFYTVSNPFNHPLFKQWSSLIDSIEELTFLEPFAGANNIVVMIQELGFDNQWHCFDINGDSPTQQQQNQTPDFPIHQQDTLENFPMGYKVCVTNPPYLAKNSATRSKLPFPDTTYDDLYKFSVKKMLDNVDYVAAIIPESFLTADTPELKERLYGVISLTRRMFDDTDHPVCLALFTPQKHIPEKGYFIYSGETFIGHLNDLEQKMLIFNEHTATPKIVFNDPQGELGLRAVDSTTGPSIAFVEGDTIESSRIKVSSRSLTRIHIDDIDYDLEQLIKDCNAIIETIRYESDDVFMTSFKGLRKDNKYRRRLDFKMAKKIIAQALEKQTSPRGKG